MHAGVFVMCVAPSTHGAWSMAVLLGQPFEPSARMRSEGLRYLVCHSCLSVCLLPRFLPLRATRRPKSDTNGFSATLALFKK